MRTTKVKLAVIAFMAAYILAGPSLFFNGPRAAAPRAKVEAKESALQKGKVLKHEEIPLCVAFSPDGKTLASGGFAGVADRPVRLWNLSTGKQLRRLTPHRESVTFVAFSPDGKNLVCTCNRVLNCLAVWDLSKNTAREFPTVAEEDSKAGAISWPLTASFISGGKALAAVTKSDEICSWDVESGKARPKQTIQANEKHKIAHVAGFTFSADGSTLASWGGVVEKSVRLWNTSDGKERLKLPAHEGKTLAVAFSPDGKMLASVGDNNTFWVYDTMTGKETFKGTLVFKPGKNGELKAALALSPDGKTLAVARDRTMQVWDIAGGKELSPIMELAGTVYCLAFSPNGKILASGGDDQCVQLWEIVSPPKPK